MTKHISDFFERSRNQVRAAMHHLLAVVRAVGVQQESRQSSLIDEQLRHFDEHLLHAKGLVASTRLRRTKIIRALLSMTSNSTTPSADELRQFMAQELSRVSAASGGVTATAVCAATCTSVPLRATTSNT